MKFPITIPQTNRRRRIIRAIRYFRLLVLVFSQCTVNVANMRSRSARKRSEWWERVPYRDRGSQSRASLSVWAVVWLAVAATIGATARFRPQRCVFPTWTLCSVLLSPFTSLLPVSLLHHDILCRTSVFITSYDRRTRHAERLLEHLNSDQALKLG